MERCVEARRSRRLFLWNVDGMADLGCIAGLLGRRMLLRTPTHEQIHFVDGCLQVRNLPTCERRSLTSPRFPFPLTATYLQLLLTHVLLIGFASLTRGLANPLRRLGLGAAVAPAYPIAPAGGAFRTSNKKPSVLQCGRWLANGSGGIAGGGMFEFERHVAKQTLPLAIVFVLKVLLSNISFA